MTNPFIALANHFFPSPLQFAERELKKAELALLQEQTNLEYSRAMVQFREEQVSRLKEFVIDQGVA